MNRFDRITAILLQLHTRRVVKGADLAEKFGISLRTLYRDIRSLEQAGVPIVGEAGVGYSLMEGYRLPPVLFTRDEALALVMAEKMVDTFADASTKAQFDSALQKIKAVLQTNDKDALERIEDNVRIYARRNGPERPPVLQVLLAAIADRTVVQITYHASDAEEALSREVEPVGIFQHGEPWYLVAWCRLRQAYRTFRTDRIHSLELTRERFIHQHPNLGTYLADYAQKRQLTKVVLLVDPKVVRYLGSMRDSYGFVRQEETEAGVEMTFLAPSEEGIARWVLMFADQAQVLEPASVEERMRTLADDISKKIGKPETLLT